MPALPLLLLLLLLLLQASCAALLQDGGAGALGTLVGENSTAGWWNVKWDAGGSAARYRVGANNRYDLAVSVLHAAEPLAIKHAGVSVRL